MVESCLCNGNLCTNITPAEEAPSQPQASNTFALRCSPHPPFQHKIAATWLFLSLTVKFMCVLDFETSHTHWFLLKDLPQKGTSTCKAIKVVQQTTENSAKITRQGRDFGWRSKFSSVWFRECLLWEIHKKPASKFRFKPCCSLYLSFSTHPSRTVA